MNDATIDPRIVAMLQRWRAVLDPSVCTPAVMEAASLPPHATMIERSEAAGAVYACMALRDIPRVDLALAQAQFADRHSGEVAQVLTARDVAPDQVAHWRAHAWLWCHAGFMQRVQRALVDLAAGRSLVEQGIVVDTTRPPDENPPTA